MVESFPAIIKGSLGEPEKYHQVRTSRDKWHVNRRSAELEHQYSNAAKPKCANLKEVQIVFIR